LNGALVAGGDVLTSGDTPFLISPDGSRVVYLADQQTNEVFEIYSAPIDGTSAAVKLNGAFVAGGDVESTMDFAVSPEGGHVIYRADQDVDEVFELFSVPVTGGQAPIRLNAALPPGGNVSGGSFGFTPSGQVVYRADQTTDDVTELYVVPIQAGSQPVKLNAPLVPGSFVTEFAIAPNGHTLVYVVEDPQEVQEIYEVRLRKPRAKRR
jgi:hypothetical protein